MKRSMSFLQDPGSLVPVGIPRAVRGMKAVPAFDAVVRKVVKVVVLPGLTQISQLIDDNHGPQDIDMETKELCSVL